MPSPRRSAFLSLYSLICWCCCLGALLGGILGISAFVAPKFWLADNMSFFLRQFLAAGLIGTLVGASGLLLRHRMALLYKTVWVLSVLSLVCLAGLTGARTLANTAVAGPLTDGSRTIKVISINIEHLFLGDAVLAAFLEQENADVIVIQESLWWLQERRWERLGLPIGGTGKNGFPDYLKVGELGGLAVYSRFPIVSEETRIIEGTLPPGANVYYNADRELLSLTLETGDTSLHLVLIHPDSPRTKSRWKNKRRYFDEVDRLIEDLRSQDDGSILAIGDWNSAPWSGRFHETLSNGGLKTAYPNGWPQTTRFFFDYRLHWILGSPVDQFGISDDIQLVDVSLGPHIGSDHLPLIVELALPQSPSN